MSPIISGLAGAIAAYLLVTLAERRQRAGFRRADGWTVLRPGWLIKLAILLSTGLAGLIGWFFWSGGSTRPDAAPQNLYALGLLAVFAAGSVYVSWASYWRTIASNDAELRVRRALGGEIVYRLSDLASAERNETRGEYRLQFRDGSGLGISIHFDGARELIERLPPGVFREREEWR